MENIKGLKFASPSEQELDYIFDECRSIIRDRDEDYGDYWKTEDFELIAQNVLRKSKGFENLLKNKVYTKKTREQLIDLINYSTFIVKRLDMMELNE